MKAQSNSYNAVKITEWFCENQSHMNALEFISSAWYLTLEVLRQPFGSK